MCSVQSVYSSSCNVYKCVWVVHMLCHPEVAVDCAYHREMCELYVSLCNHLRLLPPHQTSCWQPPCQREGPDWGSFIILVWNMFYVGKCDAHTTIPSPHHISLHDSSFACSWWQWTLAVKHTAVSTGLCCVNCTHLQLTLSYVVEWTVRMLTCSTFQLLQCLICGPIMCRMYWHFKRVASLSE